MARTWTKVDLINRFAQLRGYRTYLEVCTPTTGGHFAEVDRLQFDPCHRLMYRCSDTYDDGLSIDFRSPHDDISNCIRQIRNQSVRYDVVLVDGHHEYETTIRDLNAVFELLTPSGLILIHDCLPETQEIASPTIVEGAWMGLCYKAFLDFALDRADLEYCTLDCDQGCGIIRKKSHYERFGSAVRRLFSPTAVSQGHERHRAREVAGALIRQWKNIGDDFQSAFGFMQKHKSQLMKLTSVEEFSGANLDWPDSLRLDFGVVDEVRQLTVPKNAVEQDISDLSIAAIIPLYNGSRYVEGAIRSILGQSHPPAEIIVIDDGSVDNGPAIVERLAREHPIKYVRKANGGQSSARNLGVTHSSSALIAFLDQDDFWYSNHLKTLFEPFRDQHAVPIGWVYSDVDEVDESGAMISRKFLRTMGTEHPKRHLNSCLREDMFILPSASLISRVAFERAGGFDETLMGYEDDDLFLKLFRLGFANVFVEEPLSQWRIHVTSASYTRRMARSRMNYARKLFAQFPDEPILNRFPSRDLIAPRFAHALINDFDHAVRRRDSTYLPMIAFDLRAVARHLKPSVRWRFYVALPLMGRVLFARLVMFAIRIRRAFHASRRRLPR
jgi:glycosyltransferase involved in cell wall biosynthesis